MRTQAEIEANKLIVLRRWLHSNGQSHFIVLMYESLSSILYEYACFVLLCARNCSSHGQRQQDAIDLIAAKVIQRKRNAVNVRMWTRMHLLLSKLFSLLTPRINSNSNNKNSHKIAKRSGIQRTRNTRLNSIFGII